MSNVIKSGLAHSSDTSKRIIELKILQFSDTNNEEEETTPQHTYGEILEEANSKAKKIMDDAISYSNAIRQQMEQERQNWEIEKLQLIENAKEEGFLIGIQQGKEAGYAECNDLIAEGKEVIEASKRDYDQYLQSSEEVILKLGIKIAEKILSTHLTEHPDDYLYLVKKAIKEVKEHTNITIHVNPSYYPLFVKQKDELLAIFNRETDIYIYPSEELKETDCLIESSFGKIDASVDSQLMEIKEKLLSFLMEE
ncbi:flagellar assembly protein FliH [Fredinandcohnia quinoae]|uniref:Flagellar assembly protein FliH n=1 Tax=Fredinandcohnia quinoae TaxID=2918902 RepID=A0AAW5E2I0_9BACI|nr:flagellar assembly protein FliH [Fredinandcohnia sp. SECRCQ15]MCH1623785.1 flagellar assembly protein FliH [Fredinandcohnia sp. SECRCQ15]